jgi:hypothetical protein
MTILLGSLLNLRTGPRERLLELVEHLRRCPLPLGLSPVLMNNDDE